MMRDATSRWEGAGRLSRHLAFSALALALVVSAVCSHLPAHSPDQSKPDHEWKFAFMSDTRSERFPPGVNETAVHRIASDMVKQKVSLVIVGGDLILGDGKGLEGLKAQYQNWIRTMEPVYSTGIPVYAVPGNHEYWGETEADCVAAWEQAIASRLPSGRTDSPGHEGREYRFTFKNALFIGLDQNCYTIHARWPDWYHGNNVEWVKKQLSSRNVKETPHVFVYGHMPQFMLDSDKWYAFKSNREDFWNTLADNGVHVYFTGHAHCYGRALATTEDGTKSLYQMIVGDSGAPLDRRWNRTFYETDRVKTCFADTQYDGYALVIIKGAHVRAEWHYYDPDDCRYKVGDSFSYTVFDLE